jgi:hypothetical protein
MAVPDMEQAAAQAPDVAFVERSQLSYIIPLQTGLRLEDAFGSIEQSQSIVDSIEQRETLFFGEPQPPTPPPGLSYCVLIEDDRKPRRKRTSFEMSAG